jgi:steroid delta-isomerase-like uncharacterized protein
MLVRHLGMSDNRATFNRLHDAMNIRDADVIAKALDEVIQPDLVIGTPLPIDATGAEAYKQVWAILLRAFPDLYVAVEDVIEEGDKLVCRTTVTGTHQGTYLGVPATGRSISYNEIFIFRFAGGRIAETWGIVDVASQLRQLGVLPGRSS